MSSISSLSSISHSCGSLLSMEQISTFVRDGILVVDNVLTEKEISEAMEGLEQTLREHGVDVHDLEGTGVRLAELSSTNGAGGVLDVFYPSWKMKIATNEALFGMTCQLWREAYCHRGEALEELPQQDEAKWHPFGAFDCDKGYMYIDRIGYRIPSKMAEKLGKKQKQMQQSSNACVKSPRNKKGRPIQRSLTPHFDCCPETFFLHQGKQKWRPIQCFVSLTENTQPNTGGFEALPKFHTIFRRWAQNHRQLDGQMLAKLGADCPASSPSPATTETTTATMTPPPCVGEYTHLRPKMDQTLFANIRSIPVKAGSAVFWDNRIPHANSYKNNSDVSRAVVYCSFLPDVSINRSFVRKQWNDVRRGRYIRVGDRWINLGNGHDNDDQIKMNSRMKLNDSSNNNEHNNPHHCHCQQNKSDLVGQLHLSDLGKKLIGMVEW